jgi:hypothetical protein
VIGNITIIGQKCGQMPQSRYDPPLIIYNEFNCDYRLAFGVAYRIFATEICIRWKCQNGDYSMRVNESKHEHNRERTLPPKPIGELRSGIVRNKKERIEDGEDIHQKQKD